VAVPTGSYDVTASVDLTPIFGIESTTAILDLVKPGREAFARRLEQLGDDDPEVRREAMIDLYNFREEREKVSAAAAKLLRDPDPQIRALAVGHLLRSPEIAKNHLEDLLWILEKSEGGHWNDRANAALFLSAVAPRSERVARALEAAATSEEENLALLAKTALDQYRRRHPPEEGGSGTGK
jgi:hypothetical protein